MLQLPDPLRWWYELAGSRNGVLGDARQNRLLPPQQAFAPGHSCDEPQIFYVEHQGVVEWATQDTGVDPPVWARETGTCTWIPQTARLSDFLVGMFFVQGPPVYMRQAHCSWLAQPKAEALARVIPRVDIAAWDEPYPATFHATCDVLMVQYYAGESDGERGHSVSIYGRNAAVLAFLRPQIDSSWEHVALGTPGR